MISNELLLKHLLRFDSGGPTLSFDSDTNLFVFWTDTCTGDIEPLSWGSTIDEAISNFPVAKIPK